MEELKPNQQLWHYKDDPISPSIGTVREVYTHDGYTGAIVEVQPKGGSEIYYQFYIQDGKYVKLVHDYILFNFGEDDAEYYIRRLIEGMHDDGEQDWGKHWKQERAMQEGMLHGCDAYNEEMGYDLSFPEPLG